MKVGENAEYQKLARLLADEMYEHLKKTKQAERGKSEAPPKKESSRKPYVESVMKNNGG